MKSKKWTHITMFDKPYSPEKTAEGLAVSQAVVNGACNKCPWLKQCSTDTSFKMPPLAWCSLKKQTILDEWKKGDGGDG